MSSNLILNASRMFGPDLEGEALVSREPIHFTMDIVPKTGVVMGANHDLYGENIISFQGA